MAGGLIWTEAEDEIVRTLYSKGHRGRRKARALLGHRTTQALANRAARLGVARPQRRWTAREDRTLLVEWGDVQPRTLFDKLPGRTWSAICRRAEETGLGPPQQDLEPLTRVAERLGYCAQTLRAILRRRGVEIEHYAAGDRALRGRRARLYRVDPIAAEDAVRAELAERAADTRETVRAAADRHGLTLEQMETRLARLGLLPRSGIGRARWIEAADADRAAALEIRVGAAPGGLAAACRAAGVSAHAAGRLLRARGHCVGTGRLVPPDLVAQVVAELLARRAAARATERAGVFRCGAERAEERAA